MNVYRLGGRIAAGCDAMVRVGDPPPQPRLWSVYICSSPTYVVAHPNPLSPDPPLNEIPDYHPFHSEQLYRPASSDSASPALAQYWGGGMERRLIATMGHKPVMVLISPEFT